MASPVDSSSSAVSQLPLLQDSDSHYNDDPSDSGYKALDALDSRTVPGHEARPKRPFYKLTTADEQQAMWKLGHSRTNMSRVVASRGPILANSRSPLDYVDAGFDIIEQNPKTDPSIGQGHGSVVLCGAFASLWDRVVYVAFDKSRNRTEL
jgi:hypothetical protein